MIDLEELFEKHENEFLEFNKVENPLHPRPDIASFLLLDKLIPTPGEDMVTSAEHDQIWLATNIEKLAEVATEEDIITLIRCGVGIDADLEGLFMFV